MLLKIFNTTLILFILYMGCKQGLAMLAGKPAMVDLFRKWSYGGSAMNMLGAVTLFSACLLLFSKTFVWGNFVMAATILLIICLQLKNRDLKGAAVEIPFILLNLLTIYLQHPLSKPS
jgi:hypothetical protein